MHPPPPFQFKIVDQLSISSGLTPEMWLSRKNSINNNNNPSTTPRKSNFNHRHSFKNIPDLLTEDDKKTNNNVSPTNATKKKQPSSPISPSKASDHAKPKKKPSSPISPSAATTRQSVFHRVCLANQFTRSIASPRSKPKPKNSSTPRKHKTPPPAANIPDSEKRVVVYMTSLGAVRPTFDACRAVRSILQGFRVAVDERDLSMDASFRDELQMVMSPEEMAENKKVALPRVFIGGRYVGDADDMRQLSETGELKKLVEGLPAVSRGVCPGCGDFRFVICSECNGSRKCYRDKAGVFRSCTVCNKNGLIRCSTCWTDKCLV